jgi:ParB/RepB/Spo0J family partition protein
MELTQADIHAKDLLTLLEAETFKSDAEVARRLGRDPANVSKSLKVLRDAGRLGGRTVTPVGREVLALLAGQGAAADPVVAVSGVLHHQVLPDPDQPRRFFDQDKLDELEASIVELGDLIEPIVIRPIREIAPGLANYMLIAGERRWRAIGQAIAHGTWAADKPVLAVVKDADDKLARRMALIENLQRDDLRPIEEARSIQLIAELDGLSVSQVGVSLGYSDTWAQTRVRLLKLPEKMQDRIERRELKVEDARAAASMWPKLVERSPIKAKELEAGKISVADAKRWLDEQPAPLTPKVRLALLELIDAIKRRPAAPYQNRTEVQAEIIRQDKGEDGVRIIHRVHDDGEIEALKKRYIVDDLEQVHEEGVETPRHRLRLTWNGENKAAEAIPGITDNKKRLLMIAEARAEVLGAKGAAKLRSPDALGATYATPWLNGPFENPPEIAAKIAAKRNERESLEAMATAQRAQAAQERAKVEQAARDRLQRITTADDSLVAARQVGGAAMVEVVATLAEDLGLKLPLYMREGGEIVDGTGAKVPTDLYPWGSHSTTDLAILAIRRFLVGLVNAAAGHVTPAEEPGQEVATAPLKVDRETFVGMIANALLEQPDADEVLGVKDPTIVDALDRSGRALDALLEAEGTGLGDPDYDWGQEGAAMIAAGIVEDGLGDDAPAEDPNAVRSHGMSEEGAAAFVAFGGKLPEETVPTQGIVGWRNPKTGKTSDAEGHPGEGWEPVYGDVPGVDLDADPDLSPAVLAIANGTAKPIGGEEVEA